MNYKKLIGAALSVVMLVSLALPATVSAAGTANILDYTYESVIVPTALKVALNPNGYGITVKYVKTEDTEVNTAKTYYTESGGTYTKVDAPANTGLSTYYEAVTSTDQVVSLNYGIANKSTEAKVVKIDFEVSYTEIADKTAIEFVDEAVKAQAYNAETNTDGAKSGELKMYLEVVSASSSAVPTANTYAKATTWADGTTYYTEASGVYTVAATQPADQTALNAGTFYVPTTTIGPQITAAELGDVTMTKATVGRQAMVKGETTKAEATVAYLLPAATYAVKAGEVLDFTTTQDNLRSKLEMTAIGGVAAFTITGYINADADWSKADANAITITPTYDYTVEVTGEETPITGAYNQIETTPAGPTTPDFACAVAGQITYNTALVQSVTSILAVLNANESYDVYNALSPYWGASTSADDQGVTTITIDNAATSFYAQNGAPNPQVTINYVDADGNDQSETITLLTT